jgi:hypothetical protein
MHIVMLVLNQPERLDEVLDAWRASGVTGVTIFESTGIQRRQNQRERIPMRYAFEPLPVGGESGHYTLFTIVPGPDAARACLAAAEAIIGDLDEPHTGVLAAWPLELVKGVGDGPRAP